MGDHSQRRLNQRLLEKTKILHAADSGRLIKKMSHRALFSILMGNAAFLLAVGDGIFRLAAARVPKTG